MALLLILIYTITLVYLALNERVKRYIYILTIQGIILFGIAFFHLQHIELKHLIFITLETLIVKAIAIPIFLNSIRKRNHLQRMDESSVPIFVTVLVITLIIVASFALGHYLHDNHVQSRFFSVAIASILTGIYFIIAHNNVFTHLIGYLVIENGIFLLSLAVGTNMPMLVNGAILLDLVVAILVLGIFINRVGDHFQHIDSEALTQLKD